MTRFMFFTFVYLFIFMIFNSFLLSSFDGFNDNIDYKTGSNPLNFLYNIFASLINGIKIFINLLGFNDLLPSPYSIIIGMFNTMLLFISLSPYFIKLIQAIGNWIPLT